MTYKAKLQSPPTSVFEPIIWYKLCLISEEKRGKPVLEYSMNQQEIVTQINIVFYASLSIFYY